MTVMAEAIVTVRCPDCGEYRIVSVRHKRRLVNQKANAKCLICRSIDQKPKVEQRHRNFWLKSQSSEWIQEVGSMIWGDGDRG